MKTASNSRILRVIPLLLIVVLFCPLTYGKVIYVDDDAAGANNGSSWENAYVYLQDALADAKSAEKPIEIRVAQGIHKPHMGANQTAGDRVATFQLISGVTLKGGYAGFSDPDPNTRDFSFYKTILSGDLNGDDVEVTDPCNLPNEPTRSENSCHVTTGSGTDMTAVLDGFTISAGNADGSNQQYEGGGMFNSSGSPTLTDCTFNGNSALHGGGVHNWENSNPTLTNCKFFGNWAQAGGAIENNFTSSPMLTNCSFTENSAESGGGMNNGSSSNPKLVDCTFSRNRAERGGGGMYNRWLSSPMLTNCIFSGNSARYGGGMVNWDFAEPTLTDCTFSRNSGRGLYNRNSSPVLKNCIFSENPAGGMFSEDSDLTLTNCVFSENSTPYSGGGMSNLDSSLTLNNCTFTANSAWYGGGISSASEGFGETKLTLTNCTFTGNSAVGKFGRGGGMYCSTQSRREVELTMTSCTFMGNLAAGEHGRGGGIYSSIDNPTLINCIFSKNSADGSGGAIYNDEGWPEVSNCRFSGNSAGGEGGGLYNDGGGDFSVASPTLTNCTFSGNLSSYGGAIYNQYDSSANLINCILWGNTADYGSQVCLDGILAVEYSDLQGGRTAITFADDRIVWGPGNIDVDPDFVQAGYWTQPTPRQPGEPIWNEGDYHLKSEAGRWDPNSQSWVQDDITSPCIDAGDPNSPVSFESFPNGGIINMGAYGGTSEASKSPSGIHTKYGGGTGEPNDPYLIYTPEQMNEIGSNPEDWNKHFKLMADIDLNAYTNDQFNIIGGNPPFTGVFDGNRHVISNFSYTSTDKDCIGLFGYVYRFSGKQVEIKNLGLIDPNINAGTGDYVGSLIGWLDSGTITGCYVEGGNVVGDEYVGGLVGAHGHRIPGFDPSVIPDYTISYCYSTSRVKGTIYVGGMVGFNIGRITNCYSMGSVFGNDIVGGLVGQDGDWGLDPTWGGKMINCYSTGHVVGQSNTGGLVGLNIWGMIIYNCFWDIQTSGWTTSDGGTGKTTAEMQTASTFLEAGWDFVDEIENGTDEIWWIDEGQDYPRLWWEVSN